MDLSKEFDILNYLLLFEKMDVYGFSLKSTTFIESYLGKMMKKVKVNNKFSPWEDFYRGVPQGSILDHLLFNIFINDIFSFLTTSKMCNYTDNNILYTMTEISTKFKNICKKILRY